MIIKVDNIISSGYAKGRVFVYKNEDFSNTKDIECFNKSLAICNKKLDELIFENEKLGEFILFQKLMLNDPVLKKSIIKYLETSTSIVEAIDKTIFEYTMGLINSPSEYLRERVNDFQDLALNLKNNLEYKDSYIPENSFILITNELYPTFLLKNKDKILGVVARNGGYTSHSAILCRELEIPYVICHKKIECESLIIDTYKKELFLNYSKYDEDRYQEFINLKTKTSIVPHEGYCFLANASSNDDVKKASKLSFDGIGLYRTEFIFYYREDVLSYEEQLKIYSEAVNIMKDKPVTFRLFDIGDDKKVSCIKSLGKGIKNYLNNPELFKSQVLAISHSCKKPRILLPMIRTNEEFNYLRGWIFDLTENKDIKIGMMLETKDAIERLDTFTNVDFISIGTNDLMEELYQKPRNSMYDEDIAFKLIDELIPVISYAKEKNISLSLCGELASIPEIATRLFEIGIKKLSIAPSALSNLNHAYKKFKNK